MNATINNYFYISFLVKTEKKIEISVEQQIIEKMDTADNDEANKTFENAPTSGNQHDMYVIYSFINFSSSLKWDE